MKQALKCAENAYRKTQQLLEQGHNQDLVHSKSKEFSSTLSLSIIGDCLERNTNILIYVKRRLGMCARKLGKLREAAKIFRDLVKEFPMMSVFNIHENLIEVLLALQNYADVQGVLAKYDGKKSVNLIPRSFPSVTDSYPIFLQISVCRNQPRFVTQLLY